MQLFMVFYLTIALQVTLTVYAFRDYPANFLKPSKIYENCEPIKRNTRSTIYEKSLNNILSRKKRGFVFFKGAVVVLTQVLSKAIIARTPRGVLQSTEVDMFYDVPILIDGWKKPLEVFANRTKGTKKKSDKFVNYIENENNENIGVINASSIPWDKYYKISKGPNLDHFVWYNQNSWNRNNYHPNRKYFYRKSFYKSPTHNYYYNPYNNHRRNYNQFSKQHTNKMHQKWNQYPLKNNISIKSPQTPKTQHFKNNVNSVWHEHREYRERRGIFEHIEGFGKKLGISLRSCILRAICEIKTELLPEGESLINDVARIIFTIPTNHDSKSDDFVQMALEDGVDCVRRFMVSCPHSPMKYFFNNFRARNLPPMSEEEMINNVIYA
ncbi:uncharacterized protein LOC129952137 [Eupeodes corollae]|uniref:uncharacterized protein LOC129952137 n=1 Tax=Eupeodes corollae TaxID=290404 RepID=UPI002490BC40|nr:uncharacterized protein LOC129952137 [Eupeodes corollae]